VASVYRIYASNHPLMSEPVLKVLDFLAGSLKNGDKYFSVEGGLLESPGAIVVQMALDGKIVCRVKEISEDLRSV